jgi:hypothetical protein
MVVATKPTKRPKREAAGRRLPKVSDVEKRTEGQRVALNETPVTLPKLAWMERTAYIVRDIEIEEQFERARPTKPQIQNRTRVRIPTLHCESCGAVVNVTDFGGETTFCTGSTVDCIDCKRMWLAGFDACQHDFHPFEDDGDMGVLCDKCGAFVLT